MALHVARVTNPFVPNKISASSTIHSDSTVPYIYIMPLAVFVAMFLSQQELRLIFFFYNSSYHVLHDVAARAVGVKKRRNIL